MQLFPYQPRKNQQVIMGTIQRTLDEKGHFVFESGTGSGKTVCALSSAISYALNTNKKILYTTRTNSQQRQVILETRAIKNHHFDKRIQAVAMQGRNNMCLLAHQDEEIGSGTSEELSKYCSRQKKKALTKKNQGCHYFRNIVNQQDKVKESIEWIQKTLPTAEEFIDYCERAHLCPYELNKQLIKDSLLIVVPYIYIFEKNIRTMLLDWMGISEDDIILIVDEAHNLPNYLRDLYSSQCSMWMLSSCAREAEHFGNPSLAQGKTTVKEFCDTFIDILTQLRDTYVYGILEDGLRKTSYSKEDALIPSHELETELLSRLKLTSKHLNDIVIDLLAYGEKIREYREHQGKLPRSYLYKLGVFLEFWTNLEMSEYLKLVVDAGSGKNPRIEAYCLDPSLAAGVIRRFHSSIHMSGTLEPLEEYRDSLGLPPSTELINLPSPFSQDHLRILYASDVTTKYDEMIKDEKIIQRMWDYIANVSNTTKRNTMVFFPSFNIINTFRSQNNFEDIKRDLYIEQQHMSQTEIMDLVADFKSCAKHPNGATLFSVMGGRISEGMDFPDDQLEIAIIVGIPYPKPTARQKGLQNYYEHKFSKGWEYTVTAPTARKMLQSIGRLIRNENDVGVAIILDRRAGRFTRYIRDMKHTQDPVTDTKRFLIAAQSITPALATNQECHQR